MKKTGTIQLSSSFIQEEYKQDFWLRDKKKKAENLYLSHNKKADQSLRTILFDKFQKANEMFFDKNKLCIANKTRPIP